MRADARRIAHAAPTQVRHQDGALRRRRVNDLRHLRSVIADDLRQRRITLRSDSFLLRTQAGERGRVEQRLCEESGRGRRFQFSVRLDIQSGQNLFCNLVEDGRSYISAVIRTGRLVNHNDDDDRRILNRSEADERADELRLRVGLRLRINLLRRACFARRRVAVESRFLGSPVDRHLFKHMAHGLRSFGGHDPALFRLCVVNN